MLKAAEDDMLRHVVIVAAFVGSCACGATPVSPTPVQTSTQHPTAVPTPVPAARVFASAAPLSFGLQDYTRASQFVLYDDGTFVLQYPQGSYRGTYQEAGGNIVFSWEGWSAAGPWGATGTLVGARLTVRYNIIMQLTDFEDAVYTLVK
jgi:hypothetical protein